MCLCTANSGLSMRCLCRSPGMATGVRKWSVLRCQPSLVTVSSETRHLPRDVVPQWEGDPNTVRYKFCMHVLRVFRMPKQRFQEDDSPVLGTFFGSPPEQIFRYPPGWRGHIVPSHPLKKLGNSCRKRSGASTQDLVAYPLAADNVSRPPVSRLKGLHQLVVRSRLPFSAPRSRLLACL